MSVLTQHGDCSNFTLSANAKIHWEIISRASSYSSNRYVGIAQTGQVVDRNANCFTGWRPCNLHASCCIYWQWMTVPYTEPLLWCMAALFFLFHFYFLANSCNSTVKPFFFWWKFGLCTAYPCKRITNHKAKWPSVATDAQLRYRVVLLDVYWNKRKTERDWKDRAVRLIPHNSAPYSSFQGNWLWLIDDFPV